MEYAIGSSHPSSRPEPLESPSLPAFRDASALTCRGSRGGHKGIWREFGGGPKGIMRGSRQHPRDPSSRYRSINIQVLLKAFFKSSRPMKYTPYHMHLDLALRHRGEVPGGVPRAHLEGP
eukprot:479253-Prorocentrum_minimum.AAC.1